MNLERVAQWVKALQWNRKVPCSNPIRCLPGLRNLYGGLGMSLEKQQKKKTKKKKEKKKAHSGLTVTKAY